MKKLQTLSSISNLKGKTILLRADFNVPMENEKIMDASRIKQTLPTIKYLQELGAKTILISHLGRPKGKKAPEFSLEPIAQYLKVKLVETIPTNLENDEVVMLENIRFHAEEETNDLNFAKSLAAGADYFVNDAFSVSHRAHATTEGLSHFLPSFAGLSLEQEIQNLDKLLHNPPQPVIGLFGGAKMETKLPILKNMLPILKTLVVGGGMANTFLKAKGFEIGKSLCEDNFIETAKDLLSQFSDKIILPSDVVVQNEKGIFTKKVEDVEANDIIFDIGTESVKKINALIDAHNTLLWNGTFGYCEKHPFELGTTEIVKHIASRPTLFSVSGGGDTLSFLNSLNLVEKFSYVSTAGGAFLEYISGDKLPGIECLKKD